MTERFAVDADIETGQERKETPTLGHTQVIATVIASEMVAALGLRPIPVAREAK